MKKLITGLLFLIFTINANAISDEKFEVLSQKIIYLIEEYRIIKKESDSDVRYKYDPQVAFWINGGSFVHDNYSNEDIVKWLIGTDTIRGWIERITEHNKKCLELGLPDDFNCYFVKLKTEKFGGTFDEYLAHLQNLLDEEEKIINELEELVGQIRSLIIPLAKKGHLGAILCVSDREDNLVKKAEMLLKATRSKNYIVSGMAHNRLASLYLDPDYKPLATKNIGLKMDMKKAMYHYGASCDIGYKEGCEAYNRYKKKGYSE